MRASAGALRHPRPPQGRRAAGFTARARAASSAVCNPAGEEGIAATSQPGGFQRGGASREAAALPAIARARAPAPTCPCGPGECGSRSRAASRVPARRRRLSAHYVMPRHAPAQPTGARAPPNVNTARTWLARPGHVRGGPGRRRRAALRRCREPVGRSRGDPGSDGSRARGGQEARGSPPRRPQGRPPPAQIPPQRAPSALSAVPDPPQSGSYLHSPPWCPRGGDQGRPLPAEGAAPPAPQRRAAPDWRQRWSRGPLMGRAGGAPGTRGRSAGCS